MHGSLQQALQQQAQFQSQAQPQQQALASWWGSHGDQVAQPNQLQDWRLGPSIKESQPWPAMPNDADQERLRGVIGMFLRYGQAGQAGTGQAGQAAAGQAAASQAGQAAAQDNKPSEHNLPLAPPGPPY